MHKLAKGLKKKKKGKKSKHKEEELFKPEELEAYRRDHAATSEESTAKNEEWRNFLSLTSGVDDILKKTQDDLDRIKSTSFFQRIPPASETKKKKAQEEQAQREYQLQQEASAPKQEEPQLGIVQVSESESDEEYEDDIFDTAYIDAIAAGEVKLAYIPESPTEKPDGDDPFDTSIAERAILGPAVDKKGKKLVPLGAAVEVLTGRVQLPTCATKPLSNRRQILKEKDLLLGSFDSTGELAPISTTAVVASPVKTLLDDDEIPLPDAPIDLSKSLYIPPPPPQSTTETSQIPPDNTQQSILKEFEEDEDDKEFEALASESLTKTVAELPPIALSSLVVETSSDWKFEEDATVEENFQLEVVDPFDTTFADNILPGKAELKLIEKEILENDADFDPRAPESERELNSNKKSVPFNTSRVPESELSLIKPAHRDLLGGSTSDLSKLGDKPILPTEEAILADIKYCDPFDTSIIDAVKAPGQAELKFIEKELLGDLKPISVQIVSSKAPRTLSIDDDDFNPRALEAKKEKSRTLSRPDVLNVAKTVSFAVPSNRNKDLLGSEDTSKVSKPLTPFYVRKNSVPGNDSPDSLVDDPDPFDTSYVPSLAPGKAELKAIENELINANVEHQHLALEDPDFDPRDDSKIAKVAAVEAIKEISKPKHKPPIIVEAERVDLLSAANDISAKVLTPAAEINLSDDILSYADPFDTSIATNIQPGRAELKLLENELIEPIEFERNKDLLVHSGDTIIEKPLSPELEQSIIDIEPEDFDPFDTTFASNIQPGRAELKALESELI